MYSRADRASPGCTRGERGSGCGVCASPRPPAFAPPPRLVSVSRSSPAPLSHSAAMVSLRLNTSPRVPSFSGPMALATALLCVPRPARLSSPPRRHLRPDDLALSTSLTLPALLYSVVSIFSEPYWSVSPRCGPPLLVLRATSPRSACPRVSPHRHHQAGQGLAAGLELTRIPLARAPARRQNFYIIQGKALNTTIKLGAWGACTKYRVRLQLLSLAQLVACADSPPSLGAEQHRHRRPRRVRASTLSLSSRLVSGNAS